MKEYEFHEFASLLPLMKDEELQRLVESMRADGFDEKQPIVLYEGKILDGRNRKTASVMANVKPVFTKFSGTKTEALAFVRRFNVDRRHLTSSQIAAFYAEFAKRNPEIVESLQQDAKQRQREAGETAGRGRPKQVPQKIGEAIERHANETDAALAKLAGTNRQYMADARKVMEQAPKLFEQVKDGTVSLPDAAKQVRAEKQAEEPKLCRHCELRDVVKNGRCEKCLESDGIDHRFTEKYAANTARVAITQLKTIPKRSKYREHAFELIEAWISSQRAGAVK